MSHLYLSPSKESMNSLSKNLLDKLKDNVDLWIRIHQQLNSPWSWSIISTMKVITLTKVTLKVPKTRVALIFIIPY